MEQEKTPAISQDKPRMLRNVTSNWLSYAVNIVIAFFLSPYVVHRLGSTSYGVWTLVVSLVGYMGLLDFGMRGAVTRYIVKFRGQSQNENASRLLSSALAIFTVSGCIAILVASLAAIYGPRALEIPPEFNENIGLIFLLGGFTVAASLVGGAFGGVVAGVQRLELLNAIDIAGTGLRAVAVLMSLHLGYGLLALTCIELAITVARGSANCILSFRLYPQLRVRWSYCERSYLNLIFSFSLYSFLLQVFSQLINYSDVLVIGFFLPVGFVTLFSIAGNLTAYSRVLITGVSTSVSPMASLLQANGRLSELGRATQQYAGYCSMLMLPIAVTFLLRGPSFIDLWMGVEYGRLSGNVLRVLALLQLVSAGNAVICAVALGIGEHKRIVPALLLEGLINLVLSCLLIRPFGIVGVAMGTVIPGLLSSVFFWPWYLRRCLGISILSYIKSTWIRPLAAVVPFGICTYAVEHIWGAPNLFIFMLQVGGMVPLALLGFWYFSFTPSQRAYFSERLFAGVARQVRST